MDRAALSPVAPRVAQFVRMLASDRDPEVVAAARALRRALVNVGLDLNDLGDLIEREPPERVVYLSAPRPEPATPVEAPTWADLGPSERRAWLALLAGLDCLKPFEASFVAGVARQVHGPTVRQAGVLDQIIAKAFSHGWRA